MNTGSPGSQRTSQETQRTPFKSECGKCGATRVDSQLGLEATPEEYVANMVAVFREVRRVLADHGTVWLNLGSSYFTGESYPLREIDAAWLAAIIDGEGCIQIHQQRRPPESNCVDSFQVDLGVGMMTPEVVHRCHEITGLGSCKQQKRGVWDWSCRGQQAAQLLRAIYPYLLTKRKQAALAIMLANDLASRKYGRGNPAVPEVMEWRAEVRKAVSDCNQRLGTSFPIVEPEPIVLNLKPKDDCGIPHKVAFALRDDGWYLRSDIIWAKPNPMPESITDRPTKAHEYIFLLSKQPRYFFDQEAVREPFTLGSEDRYKYAFGGAKNEALTQADKEGPGGNRTALVGRRDFPVAAESAQETLDPSLPPESPRGPDGRRKTTVRGADGSIQHRDGERWPGWASGQRNTFMGEGGQQIHREGASHDLPASPGGRNVRSVWEIPTHSFPEAHFATFPQEIVRRCLLAGCPTKVCATCGVPQTRVMKSGTGDAFKGEPRDTGRPDGAERRNPRGGQKEFNSWTPPETTGWSDCGHNDWRAGVVLDPFGGSGTTALVARAHQRHSVLVELNPEYVEMIARRLQQLSLLA